MKKFWLKADITKELEVSQGLVDLWINEGAPKFVTGKGYPVEEFCRWLVSKPKTRKERTPFRDKAEKILNELCPPVKKKKATKKAGEPESGLVAALERARQAEVDAYTAHIDHLRINNSINTNALDAWQKTLEILRRCENDFTKVLEMRKELISYKKVQSWLQPLVEQTKMQLLNLPSKLAPQLENLPWHEIQKKLEEEIRDAISKLGAPEKDVV
jgi:hypothetical protein